MTEPRVPRPATRARIGVALALLGVIVAWLAIGGFGGPKIGQLSSVQSNDTASFLPASAESVRVADEAQRFEPDTILPAFVVLTADGGATPQQLAAWQALAGAIPSLEFGRSDGSAAPLREFLAPGARIVAIPSQDGTSALLVVPLLTTALARADGAEDPPLPAIIETLRGAATGAADGGSAHVTGPAGLVADLTGAFAGIDGILLLVALGVVLLILLLVYRALALPVLVLLTSVLALTLAGAIVYLLADADVLTLNGQSQGILFILVIGAATDYGLLLTARHREELQRVDDAGVAVTPVAAMRRAWRACVEPIAASAATVIIGLMCLLLSDLNSNRSLGPVGAIGIASALLAALTLLPALLATGRWVFWPRIPQPARRADVVDHAPEHAADAEPEPADRHGVWARLAGRIDAHPRRVWVVTGIVLLACCAALPTFRASGTQQSDVFLAQPDSVVGQDVVEAHFPGGAGNPVVIIAPENLQQQVISAAAGVPGLAAPPEPLQQGGTTVVKDGTVLLDATLTAGSDTQQAKDTIRALRAALHPLGDVVVGGQTAQQLDTSDTSARDLRVIIPAVLLAVFLVLMLLLRSLVAPLVLVAATVLSYGSALGVSALVFNHIFDFPGADPAVPLFAFVFLVALGVDYSIFLMSRAREESLASEPRRGTLTALVTTGGVITSAGVVLAATFAALGVIPILFLAQIAFIVAFGVLLDTLVVRSLLVSALATDLGRRVWWPSRLSRVVAPSGKHEA